MEMWRRPGNGGGAAAGGDDVVQDTTNTGAVTVRALNSLILDNWQGH